MSTGTDQASVRILNPSSSPVTLHKAERVGQLFPTAGVIDICSSVQEDTHQTKQAIAQLMCGLNEPPPAGKSQLEALLHVTKFSDVISAGDGDLGRTKLTQHRIDTGNANTNQTATLTIATPTAGASQSDDE